MFRGEAYRPYRLRYTKVTLKFTKLNTINLTTRNNHPRKNPIVILATV
ncbi:MAG: hypothetical protein LBH59_00045 [Planctomycetaceae bacterium]|nr:hypothetical protein [Planctomycetaceae bacterium]